MKPIVELLLENGVGIYQMPCPEMSCYGAMRWGQVKSQYDTPMFRRYCQKLADRVLDEVEDYRRNGYQVLGFIMVDGSPTCGLSKTCEPADENQAWGGEVGNTPSARFVPKRGVFCEVLQAEAERRSMDDMLYVAVPEIEDVDALRNALTQMIGGLL